MSLETIIADINWYEIALAIIGFAGLVYGQIQKVSANELKRINDSYRNAVNAESLKGREVTGSEALGILSNIVDAFLTDDSNVGK